MKKFETIINYIFAINWLYIFALSLMGHKINIIIISISFLCSAGCFLFLNRLDKKEHEIKRLINEIDFLEDKVWNLEDRNGELHAKIWDYEENVREELKGRGML
jgi:hypothetical protein